MTKEHNDQITSGSETPVAPARLPALTLGIDLDGCCDESPFFRLLTHVWPGDVIVVTYRRDSEKAVTDLENYGIRFDDVVLVDSFDAKAEVIAERGIAFYIDDQPEMLRNISPRVGVMLFRNGGNFDFSDKKWMLSDKTGKLI